MRTILKSVCQNVRSFVHGIFKSEASCARQATALCLAAVAFIISYLIYGRISYAYCHFLAGMGVTWIFYGLFGLARFGLIVTVVSSSFNELVLDMAKPNHLNVDWDQLVAGFIGAGIAYIVLVALRRLWSGRAWNPAA